MATDPDRQLVEELRKRDALLSRLGPTDHVTLDVQAAEALTRLLDERDRLRSELQAFVRLPCSCSERERRNAVERELAEATEAQARYKQERDEEIIEHAGARREANADNDRHIARIAELEAERVTLKARIDNLITDYDAHLASCAVKLE